MARRRADEGSSFFWRAKSRYGSPDGESIRRAKEEIGGCQSRGTCPPLPFFSEADKGPTLSPTGLRRLHNCCRREPTPSIPSPSIPNAPCPWPATVVSSGTQHQEDFLHLLLPTPHFQWMTATTPDLLRLPLSTMSSFEHTSTILHLPTCASPVKRIAAQAESALGWERPSSIGRERGWQGGPTPPCL